MVGPVRLESKTNRFREWRSDRCDKRVSDALKQNGYRVERAEWLYLSRGY